MLVHVYFNLRTGLWSIRDPRTRRVVDHRAEVHLRDVRFRVSEAGRQRVLRDRRRAVHAWAEGELCDAPAALVGAVRYNPYRAPTFEASTDGADWRPIGAYPLVSFLTNGKAHLGSNQ
jgi:hypothetical protein